MVDYADWSGALTLESVEALFKQRGCRYVLVKELSPRQDNDKNQIYVGKDLSAVSQIPSGEVEASDTLSAKPGASGKAKFQVPIKLHWFTAAGHTLAPNAKLIFYPQYPEVRLSGFLRGATGGPNDLLVRSRRGQEAERVLLLGVADSGDVWGLVLAWDSASRGEVVRRATKTDGPLALWEIGERLAGDTREILLDEMERIYALGWIPSVKLRDGVMVPYRARNGGGYTLEAHLGVSPNGIAEPDFLGWEIKQHGVTSFERPSNGPVTLFTPEPTAGVYVSPGFQTFMERYGYPDRTDPHRTNFGGIYKAHAPKHHMTGLRLELTGYRNEKSFDATGSVAFLDDAQEVAAEWPYAKLMEHWKRKHAAACYVPSLSRDTPNGREYRYGRGILLAGGATFGKLLTAIDGGTVYLDPALKLVVRPNERPVIKKRSQFRTKYRSLEALYEWAVDYSGFGT